MSAQIVTLFTAYMDDEERFSFHATSATDADAKLLYWLTRHGFHRADILDKWSVRPGAGQYSENIHDDWVCA